MLGILSIYLHVGASSLDGEEICIPSLLLHLAMLAGQFDALVHCTQNCE